MSRRRATKQDDRSKSTWSASVGEHGYVVHAAERADRGYAVVFRFSDPSRPGADKRVRVTTAFKVRDNSGQLRRHLISSVLAEAKALSHKLALGQSPTGDNNPPESDRGDLTLREGFDRVLDSSSGKYHVENEWVVQLKSFRELILKHNLFPRYWVEHKRTHFVECWRKLARMHKAKPEISGRRHAEMLTSFVVSTAKWLIANQHLPEISYANLDGWRAEMREVFDAIVPEVGREGHTPRHDKDELSAIFGVLGDPRIVLYERLLPLVITDQREESLSAAHRSALTLGPNSATLDLQWVRQRRNGDRLPLRRRVELADEARVLLKDALEDGHLQHLESAYHADGLDYPLFPASLRPVRGAPPAPLCATSPNLLDIDPRISLAIELGGELRVGQVLKCTRRSLSLTPSQHAPYGLFRVPGRKNKRGATIVLNARQRAAVDHALCSYLSLFEGSFDPEDVKSDYYLFPSGSLSRRLALPPRLSRGEAKTRTGMPLGKDAALKQFRVLEEVVGVESAKGRGWYGIRRGVTDVAPDHTSDARELDEMGGWAPGSATRRGVYEKRENEQVRGSLAKKRDAIRGRDSSDEAPPSDAEIASLVDRLAGLPADRRREVLEILRRAD